MTVATFRKIIWAHYKKRGRHDLPWRKTKNPYRILVSEVMLQQTQVDRVIPFYKNFLKQFPTAKALAAAPLSEVLRAWQGLGYNRRAKMLRLAAQLLALKPVSTITEWEALPGIGPYTARAVAAFARNENVVFVETNIRTVIIHHFFPTKKVIADTEIAKILTKALPAGKSREWYSALMDYGSYLKQSGISHNAKSKTFTKQKAFHGSLREARGAILRELLKKSQGTSLTSTLGAIRKEQLTAALAALIKEGLVEKKGRVYRLTT
ncbi:MAG: hypothetical protein JWN18_532 [Parcubacteria group bacterium]|nr:hypothetical protein [Parcubacteria group bacterium]